MGAVVYFPAIQWGCPGCKTLNFGSPENYDLDDSEDFEDFSEHASELLAGVNEAHVSADLQTLTFAQAEARGLFDDLQRAPKIVTCAKCSEKYDCISPDEVEDEPEVGN